MAADIEGEMRCLLLDTAFFQTSSPAMVSHSALADLIGKV